MKIEKLKLEKFGYREMAIAGEILKEISNGLPEGFAPYGLAIELNPLSGEVFLVNDYDQIAMMHGDSLEMYYILPHSGIGGFWDELEELDLNELHYEDQEYLKDIVL
ncbi:hypothetical protein M1M16_gp37 [Methanobacterium virus Drs3]|uniref:Uncharacterized protein n=1 Tax=Methanobacterium virus Drs3 TaxID=1430441 RepID=A0A385AH87_9CAUD|nr:hypothetical protein M1M16_gp37 [Methanobacterium virus Drs3]AXN53418.1 hypothetical protein Drs3_00037 [Methanobacterium virus Drs3]